MAKKSGNRTIAEEYIISIIPELDQKKFDKVREKVGEITKVPKARGRKAKSEEEIQKEKEDKERKKREKEFQTSLRVTSGIINNSSKGFNTMMRGFGKFSATAAIVMALFTTSLEVFDQIADRAKDFSNSMITAGSAFVNRDTRQLMATFGVSGQQATGMQSVMDLMGINTSDFKMMTPAQMQLYTRLMAQWQAGMESIGQSDLQKFQETMQSMQSEMASAKLELQIELYRLLVSMAPEIKEFFSSIISLVKTLGELMNSPLVKTILSTLSNLISGVVRIVSALGQVLSFDFVGAYNALAGNDVGGSNNTTNYYSISTNSTNNFSGDTSSMYAIATQTQQDEINSIATTIHSTGGA